MISSLLNEFGSGTNEVVIFWLDVFDVLASVVQVTYLFKVVFHHVDVVLIVLHVDARVSNQKDAEFVKALSYFLALKSHTLRHCI